MMIEPQGGNSAPQSAQHLFCAFVKIMNSRAVPRFARE
jgi:hypothetical protein